MGSGRQNIHTPDTAPGIDVGLLGADRPGQSNLAYWGGGGEGKASNGDHPIETLLFLNHSFCHN